jgi:hypothetical protein
LKEENLDDYLFLEFLKRIKNVKEEKNTMIKTRRQKIEHEKSDSNNSIMVWKKFIKKEKILNLIEKLKSNK